MSSVVSAILNSTSGLTSATLFGQVTDLAPLIIFIVPIALALTLFRKLIKGIAKGRVRV